MKRTQAVAGQTGIRKKRADGETSTVTIVHDAAHEPDETVTRPGGAMPGVPAAAALTIVAPPDATIFDARFDRMAIAFSGYDRPAALVKTSRRPSPERGHQRIQLRPVRVPCASLTRRGHAGSTSRSTRGPHPGSSCVWVQVPPTIWAFWGEPDATAAPAYTRNGDSLDPSFVGVWHMGGSAVRDSTANRLHGTKSHGAATVQGLVGDAQSFASASSPRAAVPSDPRPTFGHADSCVLSAWAYVPKRPTGWHGVATKSMDIGHHQGIWEFDASWVYGCGLPIRDGGAVTAGAWNFVAVAQNAENSRAI